MRRVILCGSSVLASAVLIALAAACGRVLAPERTPSLRFEVSFPASLSAEPIDGRLLLIISDNDKAEPRFQVSDGVDTQQIFGVDVEGMRPGQPVVIDATAQGYPLESTAAVPSGTYFVQALLHRYETFNRSDGKTVKLPMDRGEGAAVEPGAGKPVQHADRRLRSMRRSRPWWSWRWTRRSRRSWTRPRRSTSST